MASARWIASPSVDAPVAAASAALSFRNSRREDASIDWGPRDVRSQKKPPTPAGDGFPWERRGQEANGSSILDENANSKAGADFSGAVSENSSPGTAPHSIAALAERYPRVSSIVAAWPHLPPHVQDSILLLVDSALKSASLEGDWA